MPSKRQLMKLSPDEELFLRHWIYEEVHFREGSGAAKRLQIQHRAIPADLAKLIAAAIPDPETQESMGNGPPPPQSPRWPWSESSLRQRIDEAQRHLVPINENVQLVPAGR